MRPKGGVIGAENNPTSSAASGVWTLDEVTFAKKLDQWPDYGTYNIPYSLRFSAAQGSNLSRLFTAVGDVQTWTWSAWIKLGNSVLTGSAVTLFSAGTDASNYAYLQLLSGTTPRFLEVVGGVQQANISSQQPLVDCSSWYHLVITYNLKAANADSRIKIYVNGTEVRYGAGQNPTTAQGIFKPVNSQFTTHYVGRSPPAFGTQFFDGYMAEVHFIDGLEVTPDKFGKTDFNTGQWAIRKYSGAYGKNGYYLGFGTSDPVYDMGQDKSGNGNNWVSNNFPGFFKEPLAIQEQTVCGVAQENTTLTLTAPTGYVFNSVVFASYGTPTGSCPSFTVGACNASNSVAIVEAELLGKSQASISASNATFGDPCPGTPKRLAVVATTVPRGFVSSAIGVGTNPDQMFDLNVNSFAQASAANTALLWEGSINLGIGKYYVIVGANASFAVPATVTVTTLQGGVGGEVSSVNSWSGLRANRDIVGKSIGVGGTVVDLSDNCRTNFTSVFANTTSVTLTKIELTATNSGVINKIYAIVFVPQGIPDTAWSEHVVVYKAPSINTDRLTLPFNDGFQDVSRNKKILQTNNSVTSERRISKFYQSSAAFNGTSSYLSYNYSTEFDLGNQFTIEFWVWLNSNTVTQQVFYHGFNETTVVGGVNQGYGVRFTNSTTMVVHVNGLRTFTSSFPTNTWMHIAITYDGTNLRAYKNGVLMSGTVGVSPPAFATNNPLIIGGFNDAASRDIPTRFFLNGYLQDFKITGALKYSTGGSFTPPLASLPNTEDYFVDVPPYYGPSAIDTGVGGKALGNYPVINPRSSYGSVTLFNGNLTVSNTSGQGIRYASHALPKTGKWFWEAKVLGTSGAIVGISTDNGGSNYTSTTAYVGSSSLTYGYFSSGTKINNGVGSAYGATYAIGDVIGVAVDMDAIPNTLTFYKNGVSQGVAFSGFGSFVVPAVSGPTGSSSDSILEMNFGQKRFVYGLATHKTLCTSNYPEPFASNFRKFFDTLYYIGNDDPTRTLSGLPFSPDVVWLKNVSAATNHLWYDTIRGASTAGSRRALIGNTTTAEASSDDTTTNGYLDGFTQDGFSVVKGTTVNSYTNEASARYAAWCWDAGDGSSVVNSLGTTPSVVKANPQAGFSVVTWTSNPGPGGATPAVEQTIGHGLGGVPDFIIVRTRSIAATSTSVYHSKASANPLNSFFNWAPQTLGLNTAAGYWGTTPFTENVFRVGASYTNSNSSASDKIAYCFREVDGYSKFGSYVGNGLTNGPYINLGFRPGFLIIKRADTIYGDWLIFDGKRRKSANYPFYVANNASAEAESVTLELFSTGFRVGGGAISSTNINGVAYIYVALASHPFKYSNAV